MALKITNDYGHGGADSGAVFGKIYEKVYTLDIGKRVTEGLKRHGVIIEETRKVDTTLANGTRTAIVRSSGAKYCISHHINAGGGTGAEVLISKYNDGKLANLILQELGKLGLKNRGAKKRTLNNGQDYYFMHRLTGNVTTLIIEYCFIDTKKDRDFLLVESNRQKMADAVVKAICKHEGIKYKDVVPTPPKPTPSTQGQFYRVVTGSYGDRENAEKQLQKLKKAGFDSFIDIYKK